MRNSILKPEYIQIPSIVYANPNLTPIDGLVYGLIYWYTKLKLEKCICSNKTFADILGIKERKVSESISKLVEQGMIEATYKDDSKRHRLELIPLVVYQKKQIRHTDTLDSPNGQSVDSPYGLQNKKIVETKNNTIADAKEVIFSFKEELSKLQESTRKDYKIIAHYFIKKGYNFDNKEKFNAEFKRALRPASMLKGYTGVEIGKAIKYCSENYKVWTLETIGKRVADLSTVEGV